MSEFQQPQSSKSNWGSTLILIIILATAITVLSGFIGFGKSGFDIAAVLQQFQVYVGFGIGSLVGLFFLELYFRQSGKEYGLSTFFNSPRFNFIRNPLKLFLLSLIIFSILGLVATFYHQTFLGVGTLKEQFTVGDGILYNWVLVVTSENLGASLFAGIGVLFLFLAYKKYKYGSENFKYLAIFLFILMFIVYGFVLHQLRYSQSEPDLMRVLLFWGLGGIITALTGSIIPFLVMHGMNNTYVELAAKYANESFLIPIIIFIGVIIGIYYYFFIRSKG